jgi:glyoxylase-like metal-dependent hydrolase (beta-lactamase superfamily II)
MVHTLDLRFLGQPGAIASAAIEGRGGLALVDPGPASAIQGLRDALAALGRGLDEVEALLVTHIHLDHSGAAGVIVRENPRVQVYVHERGAPHVVDPAKLVQSASRLYGTQMERLWGEIAPVPAGNVHALRGGETLNAAGLAIRVAGTPGHASHHVSYFEGETGTVFAGDTGGVRVGPHVLVVPPTPPPDIDVEAWDESIERIRAWGPKRVFVTHFGDFDGAADHLDELQSRLHETAGFVRAILDDPASAGDGEARFVERMRRMFREALPNAEAVRRYELAVPLGHGWQGLERYWRKRTA